MKKYIFLFICVINATIVYGQNVGIGTEDPQEKLDVNGGIRSHSIYLTGPSDENLILAEGSSVEMLDQEQTLYSDYSTTGEKWQSFTASNTGILTRIQLNHIASVGSPMTIYEGEGINGTPLITVSYSTSGSWADSPPLNIPVVAGNQYTIKLASALFWTYLPTEGYSGGRSSFCSLCDFTFKTYVENYPKSFIVDSLGNVLMEGNMVLTGNANMEGDLIMEDGNIGLGTSNPTSKLHLSGTESKMRIDGGVGSVPYFSFGGEGEFAIDALNTPSGRFVIKNNGNTGIGISSPSYRLDVAGQVRIAQGLGIGTAAPSGLLYLDVAGQGKFSQGLGIGTSAPSGSLFLDVAGQGKFSQGVGIGTSAPSGSLRLDVAGNARVSERLGIGTSSPMSSLHIKTNETSGATLGVIASGGLAGNASIEIRGNGGTPYLDFANDSTSDFDERLILTNDNRITVAGGDLYVQDGPVYATAFIVLSDQRLKKDIEEVHFPISKIDKMNVYEYYYTDDHPDYPLADGLQTGLLAQEVELVYPHAVITDSEGMKGVDYGKLTPLLLDYIKQLKSENDSQKKELENLKQDHDHLKEDIEWIKKQF